MSDQNQSQKKTDLEVLQEARQTLYETEDVGKDTLQRLAVQKEQMAKTREKVKGTHQLVAWANRTITKMSKWWRN